jgi:hypothetical protein
MIAFVLLSACTGDAPDPLDTATGPREVPWSRGVPVLDPAPRGYAYRRSIVHLHSPWSHDACDGQGIDDQGNVNQECLDDFRSGLCDAGIDFAFVTDHPSHSAEQPYDALTHARPGDEIVAGGSWIPCDDGRRSLFMPGIEDELMPVALDRHVAGDDPLENDRIYNQDDTEAITAEIEAGGAVMIAHTEQRDVTQLLAQQADGITGLEIFNLHASFAPDIRGDFLGLDPLGWATDIAPFTSPDATGEPDLFVLGVLEEQTVSVDKWDTLLAAGPAVGVAGTDAHQNVLAIDLRDGERGDSYRRMLRWFSNWVLAEGDDPASAQAALESGRVWVVFEILGTPDHLDFSVTDTDGGTVEMGGEATGGTLHVSCPTLHRDSPRGLEEPEISVVVYKDGAQWQTGCGDFELDGPGSYRMRAEIVPNHLVPFMGDEPDPYRRPFPWLYSNAIRVR